MIGTGHMDISVGRDPGQGPPPAELVPQFLLCLQEKDSNKRQHIE